MKFLERATYLDLPSHFYARVLPTKVARPRLVAYNEALGSLLGFAKPESEQDVAELAGNAVAEGSEPIALAYAGHQFGGFVPQLGDGRAILLGEVRAADGRRYDVQLKGAGPTPFSRRGDGRAALGPVLREYVLSEAMAALGVPTTRALAALTTGEPVFRESALPGGVFVRVAASHLRIGTFEFFAARGDVAALSTLVDYALARHHASAPLDQGKPLALLRAVLEAQAKLVARWLGLGFVHGVMNTDNMSISGETLDYGPCAFLDGFAPLRTFSSIDRNGRYAFANQPRIALWNLARLADTLVPLVDEDQNAAVEKLNGVLDGFGTVFEAAYAKVLREKLGLVEEREDDLTLAQDLLQLMAEVQADYTNTFRSLGDVVRGADPLLFDALRDRDKAAAWLARYRDRLASEGSDAEAAAQRMQVTNPRFIPRNHQVEAMITAALAGDFAPFDRLNRVLSRPFDEQPDADDLTAPPGEEQWNYRTFCGT